MFEKLSFLEQQFEELSAKISDPEVIADQDTWRRLYDTGCKLFIPSHGGAVKQNELGKKLKKK